MISSQGPSAGIEHIRWRLILGTCCDWTTSHLSFGGDRLFLFWLPDTNCLGSALRYGIRHSSWNTVWMNLSSFTPGQWDASVNHQHRTPGIDGRVVSRIRISILIYTFFFCLLWLTTSIGLASPPSPRPGFAPTKKNKLVLNSPSDNSKG